MPIFTEDLICFINSCFLVLAGMSSIVIQSGLSLDVNGSYCFLLDKALIVLLKY